MKVVPVPYDKSVPASDQRRQFFVVPKRGGILLVAPITEQEHLGLESLMTQLSEHLPHRGGLSPVFAHKAPIVPMRETEHLLPRMNSNAINKHTLKAYYFMF